MTAATWMRKIQECSKRLSSKAAASEGARRTLRYVEPQSEARTMLADFFSILLVLIEKRPHEIAL
jgi:CYTH domain-containing protein